MRKLWRRVRWGAFVFALAIDAFFFYTAEPFSVRSFIATGLASLIMFLFFIWLANLIRGGWRIRDALEEHEQIKHKSCVHWIKLLLDIRADKTAYRWIGIPALIAVFATFYELVWASWLIADKLGLHARWFEIAGVPFHILPHNSVVVGLYIPLIFAIPFAISHVAEWSTHRYVITPLRIIVHSGIFDYNMESIQLSRVVVTQQNYTFLQQILNYGDIIFSETASEAITLAYVWGPKKFAKTAVHYSHAAASQGLHDVQDDEAD